MTIEGRNGFRLFLRLFALGNGLFALFLFALTRPRLATPLFEFPLLASLHALVLGALLPLLLGTLSRDTPLFRVACLFVCAGEMVLVTGFLSLPRSPLPMEGGLLVSAGLVLGAFLLRPGRWSFLYWMALGASALLGVLLGGVLFRPTIDPIPFSMLAAHGLLGAGLGLYPLFWLRKDRDARPKSLVILLAGGTVILLELVLKHTLISAGTMGMLALVVFLMAGLGLDRDGRLLGILCVGVAAFMGLSGKLLPGEALSLLGVLLLGGSIAGFFRTSSCFQEDSEAD